VTVFCSSISVTGLALMPTEIAMMIDRSIKGK
jgi:hypothetical protein